MCSKCYRKYELGIAIGLSKVKEKEVLQEKKHILHLDKKIEKQQDKYCEKQLNFDLGALL